jgi:hypothetical protein
MATVTPQSPLGLCPINSLINLKFVTYEGASEVHPPEIGRALTGITAFGRRPR